MLYATGDLHGDLGRFKSRELRRLRKGDTLFVCGDFGFVWDGSKREQRILRRLGKKRYNICFVEGTHDNLELLAQYPQVDFCGGKAKSISGRLYYLPRGEVYTIEGKRVFTFGGGESPDVDMRIPGVSWWESELPDERELAHARQSLARCQNEVDFIVTHDCASRMRGFIDMETDRQNLLHVFLQEVSDTCRFRLWVFGCYHLDRRIPPRHAALYKSVLPLE